MFLLLDEKMIPLLLLLPGSEPWLRELNGSPSGEGKEVPKQHGMVSFQSLVLGTRPLAHQLV